MGKKFKLGKVNKIFIGLIILEIIFLIISSFFKAYYPTPCNLPDFFHPFGTEMPPGTVCIQMIAFGPSPIVFFIQYALILTITAYLIYLIVNKIKKSKHKKWEN